MSTNKRNIVDTQKYFDILSTFGISGEKIAVFDIGERKTIYNIRQTIDNEATMELFEDLSLSNFCNRLPNSIYNNIDSENFDVFQFEKDMSGKHFDLAIMNPAFQIGGEVWNIMRQHSNKVVCLMPINKYKKNFKYVKNSIRVDSRLFDNTRITQDLYITYCDNTQNNYETYEDFYLSIIMRDNEFYRDFYFFNKENFKDITILRKENAPVSFFNENTDFVTVNRCCNREANFSSLNGLDYKWNYEGKRNFTKEEWCTNLAYIRFSNNKSLKNFNSFVYSNVNSKKLINNAMKGLNLDIVSKKTGYAIPQIDWESISDHPLWIEGKYDEAVLDVMGLKWNETMNGVIKK